MVFSVIAFGIFVTVFAGIAGAFLFDDIEDDDGDQQTDDIPDRDAEDLRAGAISANDPLSFALGLSETETDRLLDETQFDGIRDDAIQKLRSVEASAAFTPGDDIVRGPDDSLILFGGDGDDIISAGSGIPLEPEFSDGDQDRTAFLGAGDDIFIGAPNEATQSLIPGVPAGGSASFDRVLDGEGDDTVFTGEGRAIIDAGSGNDIFLTGPDNDIIAGFAGPGDKLDVLFGGGGDDRITVDGFGGQENLSVINAGSGDDSVSLRYGTGLIEMGAGQDDLYVANVGTPENSDPVAVVTDFDPDTDRIGLGAVTSTAGFLDDGALATPVPLILSVIDTAQGPATLVTPDLSSLATPSEVETFNVPSVILLGISPDQVTAASVKAQLVDRAVTGIANNGIGFGTLFPN